MLTVRILRDGCVDRGKFGGTRARELLAQAGQSSQVLVEGFRFQGSIFVASGENMRESEDLCLGQNFRSLLVVTTID